MRWAQAAVFGDCGDYLAFSVTDASVTDTRTQQQLCQDLRAATAGARNETAKIGLRLGPVVRHGAKAQVQLVLTRAGVPTTVSLQLARVDGHWRVVRNAVTCGSIGCP